jgi:hypothetical protein
LPATGFNELNGWVAAWGPSGGGVRIALMPGITPPDSTNTGRIYTVELNGVHIGTLVISGLSVGVYIAEPMPNFMEVVRIWLEPGGHVLYDNGAGSLLLLEPGTYQVYATLRAKPRSDIYGSAADLRLICGGTPNATITLRVPNPEEWGLRADIYEIDPSSWTFYYVGTWSVGAIHMSGVGVSPYFSRPISKWVAYWIFDPTTNWWEYWTVKYTGRIYVPWERIRIAARHDDSLYVKLCSINVVNPGVTNGMCEGAPGRYSIEVRLEQTVGGVHVIMFIGPEDRDEAYIPTIDGAWRCPDFDWRWDSLGCRVSWTFVPASAGSVPYFVAGNYTPGSTDGGGTPLP